LANGNETKQQLKKCTEKKKILVYLIAIFLHTTLPL